MVAAKNVTQTEIHMESGAVAVREDRKMASDNGRIRASLVICRIVNFVEFSSTGAPSRRRVDVRVT